jgi:hypothetical protein
MKTEAASWKEAQGSTDATGGDPDDPATLSLADAEKKRAVSPDDLGQAEATKRPWIRRATTQRSGIGATAPSPTFSRIDMPTGPAS